MVLTAARVWTYDEVGNRLTESVDGGAATTWSYPATDNRLASVEQGATTLGSFAYEANGSLRQDVRGSTAYLFTNSRQNRPGALTVGGVATASYAASVMILVRRLARS